MKRLNMIKKYLISFSLTIATMMGQSSIMIPTGASIFVPDEAYICAGTITVNGELIYSGTNVCNYEAGGIASIVKASSLNEDGFYKIGDQIVVALTFSRNVVVTGTPQLTLETGSVDKVANYSSGSESLTLTFNYIVEEGDLSPDLKYVSSSALSLNGGSIKDQNNNDSEILLPEPGSVNSLSAIKELYVDGIMPTIGTVSDGIDDDIIYSSSLTDLSLNWTAFDDGSSSGIKHYSVGLGRTPGEADTQPFIDIGALNYNFTDLTLVNGVTYYGVVKAEDKAGNMSLAAVSNGVTIDEFEGPPSIVTISPDPSSTLELNDPPTIDVTFSEPVQGLSVGINSDNSILNFTIDQPSSYKVSISFSSALTSRDKIYIEMSNIQDLAGLSIDKSIEYNTATLADFNQDNNVDAGDLSAFVVAWNVNDLTKELGPSTGTIPNVVLSPDGQYDLEDVMGFSRMWHWSRKNGVNGKMLANTGKEIAYNQIGSSIFINWDKDAAVAQFEFIYDPQLVSIDQIKGNNGENMELAFIDTVRGESSFAYAKISNENFNNNQFITNVNGKDSKAVDLIYQFYTEDGQLLSQGTESVMLKAVPEHFSLHQNYPNPFNPVTTINYDLPRQSMVNLVVYDIMGRKVSTLINEQRSEGYHSTVWNARNQQGAPVSAGIYFYQIQTSEYVKTRKMVILK